MINYFPTTLARGESFCNRKSELQRVTYNLEKGIPVLLISPRRYGKTSLALQALEQGHLTYAHVDLYKALSEEDIEKFILNAMGELLSKIETIPQKLIQLASDFFAELKISVLIEKAGLRLDFNRKKMKSGEIILKSLEKLDEIAKKKKCRLVLFLDEFQVVGEVVEHHTIEAVLREAAQKATHISYVFSGSNRHLMEQMFYDKKRPLYKLCDNIKIDRINKQEYKSYIQHASQKTWHHHLSDDTLAAIYEFTECHPYYINKLCSLLWMQQTIPNVKSASAIWDNFVFENKSVTERELSLLSINQRKILIFLSTQGPLKELTSKNVISALSLAPSSIQQATQQLIEKDYIYIDKDGCYCVLDPLIKGVLSM